jgi:hypothetical protein
LLGRLLWRLLWRRGRELRGTRAAAAAAARRRRRRARTRRGERCARGGRGRAARGAKMGSGASAAARTVAAQGGAAIADVGAASAGVAGERALSKREVQALYEHLLAQYWAKVDELSAARGAGQAGAVEIEDDSSVEGDAAAPAAAPANAGAGAIKLYSGADVDRKLIQRIVKDNPEILQLKIKVSRSALSALADAPQAASPGCAASKKAQLSPKVIATLGAAPALLPDKARKVVRDEELSSEQRKKMLLEAESEEADRARRRQEEVERIARAKSDDKIAVLLTDTKVDGKAIAMMGGINDEGFMTQVRSNVTRDMTFNKKTLQMTGATEFVSEKAAKRRGSEMKPEQRRLMIKANVEDEKRKAKEEGEEAKRRAELAKQELEKVLQAGPTEEQLKVTDQTKEQTKKNAGKVLKLTGEAEVLPDKLRNRLGSSMSPEQKKRMHEAAITQREKEKAATTPGKQPTSIFSQIQLDQGDAA